MRKQKTHIYISNIFSNENVFENGYNYIYIYIWERFNVNLFKDEFEKAWRFLC